MWLGALVVLVAVSFAPGCSGEADPGDPDGAYELFRDALFEGDTQDIWERTDDETRDYFQDRYERLEQMNDLIERYLPQTDHQIARTQSGAELLEEIDSGEELFVRMFEPPQFENERAVRVGSEIDELQMAEDGESAVAVTRGQQQFMLVQQDDELWYVNLADSGDFLDEVFAWLIQNEDALEQTVENLIEEERQAREEIIAELMDPEEE